MLESIIEWMQANSQQISLLLAVLTFILGLWTLKEQLKGKAKKEQSRKPKPWVERGFSNPGEPGWRARPKPPLGTIEIDGLPRGMTQTERNKWMMNSYTPSITSSANFGDIRGLFGDIRGLDVPTIMKEAQKRAREDKPTRFERTGPGWTEPSR